MWNVLNRLGNRVLMCDTDSVKYYSTGAEGEYQVPSGNALGQWEDEGILKEFVSIGLKCYGLRFATGKEEYKIKGCSLKRSQHKLIDFDSMKEILMNDKEVSIPQLSFDYKFGEGISTREFLKTVKFDHKILKGDYDKAQHQLFPFGYERCEDKVLCDINLGCQK
jgi:hypothetical protein